MANAMKIRALLKGDVTAVTVIISHPMETGQRKDGGKLVPAHFIQHITLDVGGKRVVVGQLNTAVSANPVFNFKIKDAKVGDMVVVNWEDNLGQKGTGESAISAG